MGKTIEAQGTYKVPTQFDNAGDEISYSYEYTVIDTAQDAIDTLGEAKVKSLVQRMLKVDGNNLAREKAKSANGHSTRQPLTEEEKADRKAKRAEDKCLLDLIKSKGLSLEDIKGIE